MKNTYSIKIYKMFEIGERHPETHESEENTINKFEERPPCNTRLRERPLTNEELAIELENIARRSSILVSQEIKN